jgi:hypothetical protein
MAVAFSSFRELVSRKRLKVCPGVESGYDGFKHLSKGLNRRSE